MIPQHRKSNMLTYEKANRQLQDKQCKLIKTIPEKYHNIIHQIISTEYYLTLTEEGHEAETYEDDIKKLIKFKI